MDLSSFERRKADHINEALKDSNQSIECSRLDDVHLYHDALPEMDLEEVSLESRFLGYTTKTPFFVPGMTAGHQMALQINLRIAKACQSRGWVMGVGSQRRDLESGDGLDRWQEFRERFPDLLLLGNIGLSQLIDFGFEKILKQIEAMKANALVVHLNALQECIQKEGTPRFKGGVSELRKFSQNAQIPLILKETGCGFSRKTLKKIDFDFVAIDVSGLGGTHWGRIEGARGGEAQSSLSQTFKNWGESTVDSVIAARSELENTEVWASGGVRTGLDAAKFIALGANRVGFAKPILEAALISEKALDEFMQKVERELRVALFCTGCHNPKILLNNKNAYRLYDRGTLR